MENQNFLEDLGAGFSKTASVKNVYGEPIRVGEKTIIPVASIAYGFGGGQGRGFKTKKPEVNDIAVREASLDGEGSGGGGGMYSKPTGVFEITPGGTKFIPANPVKQVLMGMAIGFLVKTFFFSKHRKK